MEKILYICDGKKSCSMYDSCQKECFLTQDEFHTKNGICHSIHELNSDRFKKIVVHDELSIYVENAQ